MLRLRAHLDQTRAQMRDVVGGLADEDLARLVKTCARGELSDLDERERLMVGLLAIVAAFDLLERKED